MRIIAGKYGGRTLSTTSGEGYRPAMGKVRAALFSMLVSRGVPWSGLRVLDLFAGSGSLAFESLSRGAEFALFVETNLKAAELINKNARLLEIAPTSISVVTDPVTKVLSKRAPLPFGLVFIDPPYAENIVSSAIKLLLKNSWLGEEAFVVAEVENSPQEGAPLNSEEFAELEVLADRNYGQTRLILWNKK